MARTVHKTTCNRDCPDACSILATVDDGRIVKLQGDPDHPVTQGFLCFRTNQYLATQYSPERLTQPLLKKSGVLAPVSWDEALTFVATELTRIKTESGPAAIFHYRSGGSLGFTKHVIDWFWHRFGPVTVHRGDICGGAGDAAQHLDFGDSDSNHLDDLAHARSIVLWGKNVVTSSPHLVPRLKAARAGGARLLLVDPVHHASAKLCDRFVQPRPGGDFALCMATLGLCLAAGSVRPDAASYCDGSEALYELARSRTVAEWCTEADVSLADVQALADAFGPGAPCTVLVGWGMGRRATGGAAVRAIDALGAVTGNVGVPGGGVSFYFKRRAALDPRYAVPRSAAPRTLCEPRFGPEILAASDPPVRAVWITAGNPVAMLPESETSARALATRELVVVVDAFLTDTARLAHVVLPCASLLEDDDVLGAYGHHWISVSRPVVPPPEGVKTDLEIVQALAARVGLADELAGSAREWKARLVGARLAEHGLALEDVERGPLLSPFSPPVAFAERRFPTTNGRAQLVTTAAPPAPRPNDEYPLLLCALSTPRSQSSQWALPTSGPIDVLVHPSAANGIADGALARLESALGSLVVRVRHDAAQRRDVAIAPKGGHRSAGRCTNALIAARTTDLGEGGALYDEPVRLVPHGGSDREDLAPGGVGRG